MERYDPKAIESKWQARWREEKVFAAHDDSSKPKYYQLETFPYPSGAGLHVGHPKGYIAEDIHARFARMGGLDGTPREVLYTMGWDAFGLPTENYAIKVGKTPQEVTRENTDNFRRQVGMFGFSYDWDREINTSSPEYYRWTQWIFIQMFKKGLAYRAKAKVNWCPKDQTVLANEQVVNGLCERCGSEIEERFMEQWMLRITDYAERLLEGLKGLDWPAATVKRQEDWIGKSEGAELSFPLVFKNGPKANARRDADGGPAAITVFTTRPDTLFGATYLVLAPEHPWVASVCDDAHDVLGNKDDVKAYVEAASHKTDLMRQENVKDKTGVELKGVRAVNPATKEEIPVWVADYVLGGYGTGAIMAVPAHDERDHEFAKKFNLPIRIVVEPETGEKKEHEQYRRSIVAVVEDPKTGKYLTLNWGPHYGGQLFIGGGIEEGEDPAEAAVREIKEETGYANVELVSRSETMHHHYFAFSKNVARITEVTGLYFKLKDEARVAESPMEDEQGKFKVEWITRDAVLGKFEDENHLLVFRRLVLHEVYTGAGVLTNSGAFNGRDSEVAKWEIVKLAGGARKTQYKIRDWSVSRQRYWGVPIPMIHCPKDGPVPVPDADLPVLLPELAEWRPHGTAPLASSPEYMHVTCPVCGGEAERDPETFDTFIDSSWYYLRYADPHNDAAAFDPEKVAHWMPVDLYIIGTEHTVLHLLYSRFFTKFLHDEGLLGFEEPFLKLRHQGLIRGADGQKMSKSKGNVVNPDELVNEYGADTVRVYEMFMGPFEDGAPWDPKGIMGAHRFLSRAWKYVVSATEKGPAASTDPAAKAALHRTIKKVTEDIPALKFNTAISALMILLNNLEKAAPLAKDDLASFVKLVHPFAPHMAQELWSRMAGDEGRTGTTYLDFEPWPTYDPTRFSEDEVSVVLQVNGKVRDIVRMPPGTGEAAATAAALANDKVRAARGGGAAEPKRVVWVPDTLVNIVD